MIPADLWSEIGSRVKSRRHELGMTQKELADATELSRTSIANLEAGRQRLVLDDLYAAAEVLGVDICVLLPSRAERTGSSVEVTRLRRRIADLEGLLDRYRRQAARLAGIES